MLGLNFPKLFYGRLSRNRVAGCRADFCEFCVCVCRHDVISFEATAAIFFVPLKYEEYKRESRCEICRTQFPLSMDTEFKKNRHAGRQTVTPIQQLIEETNPKILKQAIAETDEMIERSAGSADFTRQRLVSFLQSHEDEYRFRFRKFWPTAAIGSIQAALFGFALSFVAPLWITLGMMLAVYLFTMLVYWAVLRSNIYKSFEGRIDKVVSLIEIDGTEKTKIETEVNAATATVLSSVQELLHQLRTRFPNTVSIFEAQFRFGASHQKAIIQGRDFASTINACQPNELSN